MIYTYISAEGLLVALAAANTDLCKSRDVTLVQLAHMLPCPTDIQCCSAQVNTCSMLKKRAVLDPPKNKATTKPKNET